MGCPYTRPDARQYDGTAYAVENQQSTEQAEIQKSESSTRPTTIPNAMMRISEHPLLDCLT